MNKKYDFETKALIIGGGPAGSTLAIKLAKSNINVILVEKNDNYDKPCGGGIKSIVYEEFGIPKNLESRRVNQIDIYSSKNSVSVDIKNTPLTIVLRSNFDKFNRELAKKDGANLIFAKYKNAKRIIIENKIFYEVEISSKNRDYLIKTQYLVGADGVNSKVRKDIFNSKVNSILTHYCNIPSKNIDKCEFYFGKNFAPNEYSWVFPHGDKLSVGTVLNKNQNAKNLFLKFKKKISNDDKEKINGFYIPKWIKKEPFHKENCFLVGDSAGHVLPFTYEGIYYAMKSALILGDSIINDDPLSYEKNWKKAYYKRFKFFKNEKLKKRALSYWEGTSKPLSFFEALMKIFKLLFKPVS